MARGARPSPLKPKKQYTLIFTSLELRLMYLCSMCSKDRGYLGVPSKRASW